MRIDQFADRVVVVCLDKRQSLWEPLLAQLESLGCSPIPYIVGDGNGSFKYDFINVPRPPAWNGSDQSYSYFATVIDIIRRAHDDGIDRLMFFEDDVKIRDCFLTTLEEAYSQLPANWQMLYFGPGHHGFDGMPSRQFDFYGSSLYRCTLHLGMQGVLIHRRMFQLILDLPTKPWINTNPYVDIVIAHQYHKGNYEGGRQQCYATYPNIICERPGFSYNCMQEIYREPDEDVRYKQIRRPDSGFSSR